MKVDHMRESLYDLNKFISFVDQNVESDHRTIPFESLQKIAKSCMLPRHERITIDKVLKDFAALV